MDGTTSTTRGARFFAIEFIDQSIERSALCQKIGMAAVTAVVSLALGWATLIAPGQLVVVEVDGIAGT